MESPEEFPWPGEDPAEGMPDWIPRWEPPDPDRLARARGEWITFFEAQYQPLICFLLLAGCTWDGAHEVAMDALATSWKGIDQDPGRFWEDIDGKPRWIRASALCARTPASEGRVLELELGEGSFGMESRWSEPAKQKLAELSGRAQAVLRALWALDQQERSVMAFIGDGLCVADIAEALNLTAEKVAVARRRAEGWLGQALASTGDGGAVELVRLMADVHRELLGHIVASSDVDSGLAEVMRRKGLWVPASLFTASAQAVIVARVRANRLTVAVANASIAALDIRRRLAELGTSHAPASASAARDGGLARDLTEATERARGYLEALGPDFDLRIDLAASARLASRLAGLLADGENGTVASLPIARDLVTVLLSNLATARYHAIELTGGLAGVPVDASGLDLSGLSEFLGPSCLAGGRTPSLQAVTWTPETTWPQGLLDRVQAHSREIRPGVYQIHVPY